MEVLIIVIGLLIFSDSQDEQIESSNADQTIESIEIISPEILSVKTKEPQRRKRERSHHGWIITDLSGK